MSDQVTQQDAQKEAYSHATTTLREKYREEFDGLQAERMKALGFPDWKPRSAKEREKRRKQIEDLFGQDPELAREFGIEPATEDEDQEFPKSPGQQDTSVDVRKDPSPDTEPEGEPVEGGVVVSS
jgi:hypothetical protein